MDEFGHILREARETKGLTLTEVQDQIRINARFLDALERGEYETLPTPVHVRGFLRNYARFLKLDPQPLVSRYERALEQGFDSPPANGGEEPPDDIQIASRQDQPFFSPVNFEVDDGRVRNSESAVRFVIIIALIAALALIGMRFIPMLTNGSDGTEAITESIAEAVQSVTDRASETAVATAVPPANTSNTDEQFVPTNRNNTENAAPSAPAPTRPILPALDTIQLKLEITERTWMEITIDGDIVFSGIARAGDPPYEWEAEEEAKVNTGNAIAVFVTINDIPWGRMGERGENHEEIWRTTN